jgi:hypothetical protein
VSLVALSMFPCEHAETPAIAASELIIPYNDQTAEPRSCISHATTRSPSFETTILIGRHFLGCCQRTFPVFRQGKESHLQLSASPFERAKLPGGAET